MAALTSIAPTPAQPGVAAVISYLDALAQHQSQLPTGHYYLVNNYNPGYFGDGSNAYTNTDPNNYVFTIPPSNVRNIGNELSESKISWAYFGDQFNLYLKDPYDLKSGRCILQYLQLGAV